MQVLALKPFYLRLSFALQYRGGPVQDPVCEDRVWDEPAPG